MLGCPTQESAIEAAIQAGREKIDVGLSGDGRWGMGERAKAENPPNQRGFRRKQLHPSWHPSSFFRACIYKYLAVS